jgi:hypothetical protein
MSNQQHTHTHTHTAHQEYNYVMTILQYPNIAGYFNSQSQIKVSLSLLFYYLFLAIRNEYTNFGFLDSQLSANGEMLLIIRRDTRTPSFPMHHLISFDALTSSQSDPTFGSSKLYIYNAIWNKNNANQGKKLCTLDLL